MKTLLLSLVAILFAINAYAQPSTISYQGVLTNAGGAVVTETPNITFTLYDAATNGNQLWTETHNNVSVTNGLFQVELNSVNANWGTANFATDMWLQITVGATTLSPRVTFNASGYSLAGKATSLQMASGAGAGKILTSDANGNGSWQNASGGVTKLTNTATITLVNNTYQGHNITVNGAEIGDAVFANFVSSPIGKDAVIAGAMVTAQNTVTVYFYYPQAGDVDVKVTVIK